MTLVEYAKRLGFNLNSSQIQMLNMVDKGYEEKAMITFPRITGRQMLISLIERKKGYDEGRSDAIDEFNEITDSYVIVHNNRVRKEAFDEVIKLVKDEYGCSDESVIVKDIKKLSAKYYDPFAQKVGESDGI